MDTKVDAKPSCFADSQWNSVKERKAHAAQFMSKTSDMQVSAKEIKKRRDTRIMMRTLQIMAHAQKDEVKMYTIAVTAIVAMVSITSASWPMVRYCSKKT